jgi:hypothetical protein
MAKLIEHMYKRAAMGNVKNGPGDPVKGEPTNPFAAPVASFPTMKATSKTTPFKVDPSYNYHAVNKQVKEAGEGKTKPILKEKRKEFVRQFESGAIKSRAELRDSVQSTLAPGSSRKEIRVATKEVAGRTAVGQAIRQTGRAIKSAVTSKGGRAAKAECKGGSCSPSKNKTLGGKF